MRKPRRWHVFIDGKLQGGFCVRVACYWLCCLLCVALIIGWRSVMQGGHDSSLTWLAEFWEQSGAIVTLPLLFLPLVILDSLVWSNKLSGPLLRLQKAMEKLADSKTVEPLKIRRGDYLQDITYEFNRLAARVQELESRKVIPERKEELHDYANL